MATVYHEIIASEYEPTDDHISPLERLVGDLFFWNGQLVNVYKRQSRSQVSVRDPNTYIHLGHPIITCDTFKRARKKKADGVVDSTIGSTKAEFAPDHMLAALIQEVNMMKQTIALHDERISGLESRLSSKH